MTTQIIINNKPFIEGEFISLYDFTDETKTAYIIKSLIQLIFIHKKIKLIVIKNEK